MKNGSDDALVSRALELAGDGEVLEVFLEDSLSSTVTVVDGKPESSEERRDRGAGFRVFRDGRIGFSYSADLTDDGMRQAVERARMLARHTRQEQVDSAPEPVQTAADTGSDAPLRDTAARVELALAVEAASREQSPDVRHTRASSVTDSRGSVRIAHSGGLDARWSWTRSWAYIELVAERNGIRQTGFETDWSRRPEALDAAAIGRGAARRALNKFDSERPATGATSIVLDPQVTAGLFETLAAALSGKAILRERSLFCGKVGERFGSAAVTLVDDGTHPDGFATSPADGEGTPSRRTVLLEKGVLRGFLHDSYTAAHLETRSTGHSVRDAYTSLPGVSTRNLHLAPSGASRQEVLEAAGDGIHVDEVMGLHTVDPVSGDFSLGASGRALSGGDFGGALEGFTISGNLVPFLNAVQHVGDDLRFFPGGAGGSTVGLAGIMVSGR